MTQREEFEKWLNTLDKQTLVTMAAKQAKTINLMQTAKSTSFNLPECMDYEFHGDKVINDPFADGYNQCLSDVISMNEEYANSTGSDGWIPVSERLPEQSQLGSAVEYLVYETLNNKVQHDYYIVPGDGTSPFWNHYQDHVTDWMPLPAAPEQNK